MVKYYLKNLLYKIVLCIIFIIAPGCLYAAKDFSASCTSQGISFQDNLAELDNMSSSGRIFLIENLTGSDLYIDRAIESRGSVQAGWTTILSAHHFSALLVNNSNFVFNCKHPVIGGRDLPLVSDDCQQAVKICSLPAKKTVGNFWVSENKLLPETLANLRLRGVLAN